MWPFARRLTVASLVLIVPLSVLSGIPVKAQSTPAATSAPAEVLAALPGDATPIAAVAADLIGTGEQQWVVLYTLEPGGFFGDANAAIVATGPDGWAIAQTLSIEGGNLAGVTLVDVAGTTAVALEATVGAHALAIEIGRWDGEAFRTIFAGSSNAPALDLADLDGDGVPEVVVGWSAYCEAYAVSPRLTSVYRWDGERYSAATRDFPDVLSTDRDGILLAEQRADAWSARGRACLAGALGYLAFERDDTEAAAAACALARGLDPEWWADWAAAFCP